MNEVVSEDVADATAAVVLSVADTVEAVEDATESVAEQPSRVPVCLCPPAYGGDECSEDGLRPPKNVKPPTSALSWFSRSIAKQEDKTAKLSKSKVEINDLWEEKQEAEKMWIEALEKEEAEQREKRVEYFKLNATLVENQAKQIIKAETLQFFHNVMKFKSERNDGNVNIQSCEQAPDCQQFGWFQHLLPEGEDMCIALLVLDKLSAKCNLDPSSVDVIVPIGEREVAEWEEEEGRVRATARAKEQFYLQINEV
mmetsp:Transcript_6027/g.17736  ORF Transcript_6027/g.17736 Transcript_6027/m.17736 type:complete len:255 (+) Transcript_6027:302-1066(+)